MDTSVDPQRNIVFIGGWYYMMGRGPQWARCFYRDGYRVAVLGDISAQMLASNRFNPRRFKAMMRATLYGVHQACAVPVVPFPRFRLSRRLSAFIFETICLPRFMNARTNDRSIIWVFRPTRTFDFLRYPRKMLVLDIADDSVGLIKNEKARQEVRQIEERQAREADIVLTSAASLFQRCKAWNTNTFLVRNGVDYDFFSNETVPADMPPLVKTMVERCRADCIVGYQGAISDWFDFELMEHAIIRFPEYAFVFLGPVSPRVESRFQRLCRHDNVYYWGIQPYEWVPFFIHHFTVGLIPFLVRDFTVAVNPLKLYEYLACGTPVVSTALPEVAQHAEPGVVAVGHSPDAFCAHIESLVAARSQPHIRQRCREIAMANSWKSRYQEVKRILGIDGASV